MDDIFDRYRRYIEKQHPTLQDINFKPNPDYPAVYTSVETNINAKRTLLQEALFQHRFDSEERGFGLILVPVVYDSKRPETDIKNILGNYTNTYFLFNANHLHSDKAIENIRKNRPVFEELDGGGGNATFNPPEDTWGNRRIPFPTTAIGADVFDEKTKTGTKTYEQRINEFEVILENYLLKDETKGYIFDDNLIYLYYNVKDYKVDTIGIALAAKSFGPKMQNYATEKLLEYFAKLSGFKGVIKNLYKGVEENSAQDFTEKLANASS